MPTVTDMLSVLELVDVEKESLIAIAKTSEQFIGLNREQLLDGKRADGKSMPAYSNASVELYGKPSGPIRLYDTGAFHESFQLDVDSTGLQVIANDIHDLAEAYGDEIFGLTKSSQTRYNEEYFFPELSAKIEEITGLKIN